MRLAESFSWAHSAERYVALYAKAINYRKETVEQLAKAAADLAARA
jgi:glycogen synthase